MTMAMQDGIRRSSRPQQDRRRSGSNSDRFNTASRRNPGNDLANAKRSFERYTALARAAALAGDSVEMENCYQHAEHYFRVMRERTG
jgi:uncharacterized protein DUF4167